MSGELCKWCLNSLDFFFPFLLFFVIYVLYSKLKSPNNHYHEFLLFLFLLAINPFTESKHMQL